MDPANGFDDANITMNYAENIANGHGYVYFVGGERVEGSTSPLWTLINVIGYRSGLDIWTWLVGCGLLISVLTLTTTIRLARLFHPTTVWPALLVCIGFALNPSYFVWSVWSFMDAGLWVFLTVAFFLATLKRLRPENTTNGTLTYAALAACVVATRPEGIVAVIGIAGLAFFLAPESRASLSKAILSGIVTTVILIGARLAYFGVPWPNTFYAKVSTGYAAQLVEGMKYVLGFFGDPLVMILLFGFALFLIVQDTFRRKAWVLAALSLAGVLGLYAALGGDNFGSYRFFQAFILILIAFTSATILDATHRIRTEKRPDLMTSVAACLAVLALLVGLWGTFAREKGNLRGNFGIAEGGQRLGELLNEYPGSPSIAVIAAGGVSLGFDGPIYDLVGLNWTEMAQGDRDYSGRPRAHGAFDRAVFFKTLPDIIDPLPHDCDEDAFAARSWQTNLLDGLFQDPEFNRLYSFECWKGLAFYKKN
jgi:hypothetical protein